MASFVLLVNKTAQNSIKKIHLEENYGIHIFNTIIQIL